MNGTRQLPANFGPLKGAQANARVTGPCGDTMEFWLGIVENLSGYACPHCGKSTALFKTGGGQQLAQEMKVSFLGTIPIDPQIVDSGDGGAPIVEHFPQSLSARAFTNIIEAILKSMNAAPPSETPNKNNLVKIAIPLAGGHLSDHFGHCEEFAIIEANPDAKNIVRTTQVIPPPHEPGLLPRWLHQQGVQVIIAGGMGQRALSLFAENAIAVKSGMPGKTAGELVTDYLEGSLISGPSACGRHERGCHG